MATNERIHDAETLAVVCSEPAAPQSSDPVRFGFLTGVALTDVAAGVTVVDFGQRVWELTVTDRAGGGIAVGDTLFYASATDDIDNVTTGTPFGYALGTVGVGLAAAIDVLHVPGHGAATLGAGVIGTANIAAGALSADVAGRGKIAAGFFNAATVATKFDASSIGGRELAETDIHVELLAGTAAATDVALAAMAAGDAIVSVLSFTTAAAITSVADRTSEYAAGAGAMTKAAGTDETANQLLVIWVDKT